MTIPPFSLSNIVTVLLALACTLIVLHQRRTHRVNVALTGALAVAAVIVALLLLTEELNPTPYRDAMWLGGLVLGFAAGRFRARRLAVEFRPGAHLAAGSFSADRLAVSALLLAAAGLDLVFVLQRQPLVPMIYLATAAALGAGYHAGWCYAVIARIVALKAL